MTFALITGYDAQRSMFQTLFASEIATGVLTIGSVNAYQVK